MKNEVKGKLECDIAISYLKEFHGFHINNEVIQKFLIKSSGLGYPEGQYQLGNFYSHQTKSNPVLALKWYIASAEQGCVEAMYMVSYCTGAGIGCDVDMDLCAKWFSKAEAATNA